MEPLQVAETVKSKFPDDVFSIEEYRGQVSLLLKKDNILDICRFLHDTPEISMDHLRDLTAVDYLGRKDIRFEVVYHLYSIEHRSMVRIRAQVSEDDCTIQSVFPVWEGAGCHERECYDLLGIVFKGHPSLKRILLPEDWEGHPLRKDYPIKGPDPENDWPAYKELLEESERLKVNEWNR